MAREVGERNAVVGQAEITDYVAGLRVFEDVARGEADAMVERRVRKEELVEVLVPAVEPGHGVVDAEPADPPIVLVHRIRRSS